MKTESQVREDGQKYDDGDVLETNCTSGTSNTSVK